MTNASTSHTATMAMFTTADTLLPALEEALAHEGPALVEIITDADLI